MDGLDFTTQFQYENFNSSEERIYDENSFFVRGGYLNFTSKLNHATGKYEAVLPKGGIKTNRETNSETYNFRSQLSFDKLFADKHQITSLLGTEVISSDTYSNPALLSGGEYGSFTFGYNPRTRTETFIDRTNPPITLNGLGLSFSTYEGEYLLNNGFTALQFSEESRRYFSGYFNLAYTYDKKYTFTFSSRTDASNFVSDKIRNKFSPFFSIGGGWNIGKEEFMHQFSFIDNMKIRTSYGVSGIAVGLNNSSTITTIKSGPADPYITGNLPYAEINTRGNPDLTWEKSTTFNLGVDFSLFKSKLYGSIEYYRKISSDVLSRNPVSAVSQGD